MSIGYRFFEAGGESAFSAFQFLEDWSIKTGNGVPLSSYLMFDQNPDALRFWKERVFGRNDVSNSTDFNLCVTMPCDEFTRLRSGANHTDQFNDHSLTRYHNKRLSHIAMKPLADDDNINFWIPSVNKEEMIRSAWYVIRPSLGAGGKGQYKTTGDAIIGSSINNDPTRDINCIVTTDLSHVKESEIVVDFYATRSGKIGFAARKVYIMKHGADRVFEFIKDGSVLHGELEVIVRWISESLNWKGIGNLQLLRDNDDRLWFLEVSNRFSGKSAHALRLLDYNPLFDYERDREWFNEKSTKLVIL